jgi:hypothetical protein
MVGQGIFLFDKPNIDGRSSLDQYMAFSSGIPDCLDILPL